MLTVILAGVAVSMVLVVSLAQQVPQVYSKTNPKVNHMGSTASSFNLHNTTNKTSTKSRHVLVMSGHDLLTILNSSIKYQNNNSDEVPGKTFFDSYYKFMVPFEEFGKTNDVQKSVNKTLTKIAHYNLKHMKYESFTALKIGLIVTPTGNIAKPFNAILNVINHVNEIYEGTISSVIINYGYLKIDAESVHLVQEDLHSCNRKFPHPVICGIIVSQKNCHQSYMKRITFEPQNFVTLSADSRSGHSILSLGLPLITCLSKFNRSTTVLLYGGVTIDFRTNTFSQKPNFRSIIDDMLISVVIVVNLLYSDNQRRANEGGRELLTNEDWIRRPSLFDRAHTGMLLTADEVLSVDALIAPVTNKFRTVILKVEKTNVLLALEQYFTSFKTHAHLEDMLRVKLYVVLDGENSERNHALLDQLFAVVKMSDDKYPGMVDTLILDRDRCLEGKYSGIGSLMEYFKIYKHEKTTWEYISYKITQLKLKYPLYLGTVFDKRESSLTELTEVLYKPTKEYKAVSNNTNAATEVVNKATSLVETMTSYESLYTLWKINSLDVDFHYMIYKLDVCWQVLRTNGAQATFRSLRQDIDQGELLFLAGRHKAAKNGVSTPEQVYMFGVTGCTGDSSSIEELTEYIYFYDIVNKWAVIENKSVIVGNAIELGGSHQNSSLCNCTVNDEACLDRKCRCGLWSFRNASDGLVVENKKSTLLKLYNAKIDAEKKTLPKKDVKKGNLSNGQILAIFIPLLLLGLLISALGPYLIQRRRHKYLISKRQLRKFFEGSKVGNRDPAALPSTAASGPADSLPYNKERFEISNSSFQFDSAQSLGSGEFGQIFLGTVMKGRSEKIPVAVKTTKKLGVGEGHGKVMAFLGLLSEIKVMCYLGDHENIIKFVGANTANVKKGEAYLLLEMCSNGSLLKYLQSFEQNGLHPLSTTSQQNCPRHYDTEDEMLSILPTDLQSDMHRWSIEIAKGMEFLAEKELVHLDLAARNILLDGDKRAKISDFGLSRRLYGYSCYIKNGTEPLPWRWMSPESLQRSIYNEKSDVWAYGVTLWEIYTLGDIPYPEMDWDINFPLLLNGGYRLMKPRCNGRKMYDLMGRCWETSSNDRPTFSDIVSILNQNLVQQ